MVVDQEILAEFLAESREILDSLDRDLVALEADPANRDLLGAVFRALHTVKGTCGFLGFLNLESVAHAGENLLGLLRDGTLQLTPEGTTALLGTVDAIRGFVTNIEHTGEEGDQDVTALVATLGRIAQPDRVRSSAPAPSPSAPAAVPPPAPVTARTDIDEDLLQEFLSECSEILDSLDRDVVALESDPTNKELIAAIFRHFHTIKGTSGFLGFERLGAVTHAAENYMGLLRDGVQKLTPSGATALLAAMDAVRNILASIRATRTEGAGVFTELVGKLAKLAAGGSVESKRPAAACVKPAAVVAPVVSAGPATAVSAATAPKGPAGDGAEAPKAEPGVQAADTSVRVSVQLLDELMNLVGELVLARNQILQAGAIVGDSTFASACQSLNLITTELQERAMKTRMQPINTIFGKFPRVVRDLANVAGKKIRVVLEGKEGELDRGLIEAIRDPLTHMVRNSVDHGIEKPEVRKAAGKPAEGTLILRAVHEGGHVNIEIEDDGGGIDAKRIRTKALEKGLITGEQAAQMSERELIQLIFLPGFSTAEKVTAISGRGVGMDVVRTNIERIAGVLDIQSTLGRGTVIRMKIPLTLAIIAALVVTSGGQRFVIPQVSLLELVHLEPEQAARQIEHIYGVPVYRLRGKLLPLVYLNDALELASTDLTSERGVNIVVLQADERPFGLVVDDVNDTQEIVVKPLGSILQGVVGYAGATILGDGRVALILDVLGLATRAGVLAQMRDRDARAAKAEETGDEALRERVLVVRTPDDGRMAIRLSSVARLEYLPTSKVEYSGSGAVAQYRGEIMPLLNLSEVLPERRAVMRNPDEEGTAGSNLHVVVCSRGTRSIGILVNEILDVVEEVLSVRADSAREGSLGSVVIRERVTELLDIDAVIRMGAPQFWESATQTIQV